MLKTSLNDLLQIAQEFHGIEDGHLELRLQPEALRSLSKRCKTLHEEYMRILEKLDSFSFEEHQVRIFWNKKLVYIFLLVTWLRF